ncbi:F0F1 ATP synthase subunit A [soil metagenome]
MSFAPAFTMTFPTVLAEGASHAVTKYAVNLSKQDLLGFFTNSFVVASVVMIGLLVLAKKATTNMQLVPHKWQNFFEFIVEFLYGQVEAIVGPKVAPRAFPLLGTFFIFIITSNWFGLLPGVGTIGFGEGSGSFILSHVSSPWLRPPTSDLNTTLGMAICFMLIWWGLTMREVGFIGFLKHTFAAKGGLTGVMGVVLSVVFFLVGIIELVSIAFRPVSLSLRLYGNVFAGEQLLHTMMTLLDNQGPLVSFLGRILLPLPFYFLELLVGALQAMVFVLLCAVYIKLSTTHDDEHGDEHHGEHAH